MSERDGIWDLLSMTFEAVVDDLTDVTWADIHEAFDAQAKVVADHYKPREVTTAAELADLPAGTLLLASGTYYGYGTFTDCHVRIVPEFITGTEAPVLEVLIYGGSELAKTITFPAVVLHEPEGER